MNNSTARLTIPMDKTLRLKLGKCANDLGFDSPQALLRYVSKAIVDGRKLTFGQAIDDWGPVPDHVAKRWARQATKHEADRQAGKIKSFDNAEEALKYLHSQ